MGSSSRPGDDLGVDVIVGRLTAPMTSGHTVTIAPTDARVDLLRPTTFETTCPFKGIASYWSADVDGMVHDGIVWGYEHPIEAAAQIAGYVSFYPTRTDITVDGSPVVA